MAKNYELRKVWGLGPFKRRKVVATFESRFVAEHTMKAKLLTAKRRRKRLELVDLRSGHIVHKECN